MGHLAGSIAAISSANLHIVGTHIRTYFANTLPYLRRAYKTAHYVDRVCKQCESVWGQFACVNMNVRTPPDLSYAREPHAVYANRVIRIVCVHARVNMWNTTKSQFGCGGLEEKRKHTHTHDKMYNIPRNSKSTVYLARGQ